MNNERIWSISLLILGVITIIYSILNLLGLEISHSIRLVIASIQIVLGIVVIVTTFLKSKKKD